MHGGYTYIVMACLTSQQSQAISCACTMRTAAGLLLALVCATVLHNKTFTDCVAIVRMNGTIYSTCLCEFSLLQFRVRLKAALCVQPLLTAN